MKLLIFTQKVDKNDDILGFFHGWLLEFAKHCEKLTVICLYEGEHNLPNNVKVHSLGKEKNYEGGVEHPVEERSGAGVPDTLRIILKLKYIYRFYKYIWQEKDNYDSVFIHMNPIYIVLGGLFWRFKGKKTALWYTHKSVDLKLKIAEKLTNIIFTASKESFQLKSKKVEILGHGIDSNKYVCRENQIKEFDVLYVGRLSKIKNQKLILEAVDLLVNELDIKNIKVGLVGWFNSDKDKKYYDELKEFVEEKKITENAIFVGSKPHKNIVDYYCKSKISINLSPTGGMDKTVLESMSCGVPVIVLNKTFKNILPDKLILKEENAEELAEKISNILVLDKQIRNTLGSTLRQTVVKNYSLENLIKNISYIQSND